MEIVQPEDSAFPLTDLPTDILGEVVQYLSPNDIAALASTCKHFGYPKTGILAEFRKIRQQIIQDRDNNKGKLYTSFMTSVIKKLNKNESLDWQQKISLDWQQKIYLLRFAALPTGKNNRYGPLKDTTNNSYSELESYRVVKEIWNNLASEGQQTSKEQQLFRSAFTFYENMRRGHEGTLEPWITRVEKHFQTYDCQNFFSNQVFLDLLKNSPQLNELVIYDRENMQIKDIMPL